MKTKLTYEESYKKLKGLYRDFYLGWYYSGYELDAHDLAMLDIVSIKSNSSQLNGKLIDDKALSDFIDDHEPVNQTYD